MTDDQISRRIEDYSTLDNDDYLLFMQLLGAWAAIIVYLANIDFAKYISDRQSYWIALLCIALSIAITYLFTRRNNRTRIQGIFSVIIGAGIYTMYIYWNIYTAIFRNIVKITFILAGISVFIYIIMGKNCKRTLLIYIKAQIARSTVITRFVLAVLYAVVLIFFPVNYRVNLTTTHMLFQKSEYSVNEVYGDEYGLKYNIDRIKPLSDEKLWESLGLSKRQESCEALIECEALHLGIPFTISINFSDSMEYDTKAYYSHADHLIAVNNQGLLKDGANATLVVLLHEMRHAYQFCMCETYEELSPEERNLLCFRGVDKWCENINDYKDSNGSPEQYHLYSDQIIEKDSKNYSYKEAVTYLQEINKIISEE